MVLVLTKDILNIASRDGIVRTTDVHHRTSLGGGEKREHSGS